jgi:hypothetical protein
MYTHRLADQLAEKPTVEWSGRVTGIAQNVEGVWVSAMGLPPSFHDGGGWRALPLRKQVNWTWCVTCQGRDAWFGGNDGKIYRLSKLRAEDEAVALPDEDRRQLAVEAFENTRSGLHGRVLYAAGCGERTWFATRYEGVAMYDVPTRAWRTWLPGGREGLPDAMIAGILPAADHVWVWTWGGGIARLAIREDRWEQIRRAQGLGDDRVTTLVEEASAAGGAAGGTLWVGTFRGLSVRRAR